jgi:hypothetical protein
MAKHPHKIRSKRKDLTRKTGTRVKHIDFVGYFAGPGVFLNPTATNLTEWLQGDRVSWVKQKYLEHWKREHEVKPKPDVCSHCQDFEIWLKLQNPRISQRLLAAKIFGDLKPRAGLSRVYRAKERIENNIPSSRQNEGVLRCSCGVETVTFEELEHHKRSVHPDYEIECKRIERENPAALPTERLLPTKLSERTWSAQCSALIVSNGRTVPCRAEIQASTRQLVLRALKKHKRLVHGSIRRSCRAKPPNQSSEA